MGQIKSSVEIAAEHVEAIHNIDQPQESGMSVLSGEQISCPTDELYTALPSFVEIIFMKSC